MTNQYDPGNEKQNPMSQGITPEKETPTPKTVEEVVAEFVEKGAAIEHSRWSKWQEYFFSKCEIHNLEDGFIVMRLPAGLYERWRRQIEMDYAELSEPEKESDRREVRRYEPLLRQTLLAQNQAADERLREVVDGIERLPCHKHGGTLPDGKIPAAILVEDIEALFDKHGITNL